MSGVNGNGILGRPRLVDKRGPRWNNKSKCVSATCMVFLSGLLAAGIPPRAFAQSTARVSGLIHDQSGAVVPGATVVLRDEASGTEFRGVTDDSGFYSIDPVLPKTYTLTIGKGGFKPTSKPASRFIQPTGSTSRPVWNWANRCRRWRSKRRLRT